VATNRSDAGWRILGPERILDGTGCAKVRPVAMLERIATFCGQCNCGCPEVWVDYDAAEDRRVVITDDFGQRVQLSLDQLAALVADVKDGVLDELVGVSR
jgi:hypothetical protein